MAEKIIIGILGTLVTGGMFFTLRMFNSKISKQDERMKDFITEQIFNSHQKHCSSEFNHIKNSLERGDSRFEKMDKKIVDIGDKLTKVSDGVIVLLDRAEQRRSTDG